MATPRYNTSLSPEANLRKLLEEQRNDNQNAARPNGQEPFPVLAAKALFNTEQKAEQGGGSGPSAPYNAGNVSGDVVFVVSDGEIQKASLTDSAVVQVPSGGSEGSELELRLTASGANRNLSFNANIEIPSDSAVSFPKTLTSGKTYIVKLKRGATKWALVTLVGGITD